MTREEAIKILKAIRVYECYPKSASEETKEAIDMAIEALQREEAEEKGYCHRIRSKEERKEPKGFTADEWYREEFKGEI